MVCRASNDGRFDVPLLPISTKYLLMFLILFENVSNFVLRNELKADFDSLKQFHRETNFLTSCSVLYSVTKLGGEGGIIAIEHKGNIAMQFNSAGRYPAAMNNDGELTMGVYAENEDVEE